MFLLYNGQLVPEDELKLPFTNRAFQYNDGFFETIMLENGNLRLWNEHRDRIGEAALALGINIGEIIWSSEFKMQVVALAEKNNCGALARIKLKIWRAGEGLYTPQTDAAEWLVTAQAAQKPLEESLQTGICQTVRTIPSAYSSFKGTNSPIYVMASREKAAQTLDDLIILDPLGHVAELTFSNIFWTKGSVLYTPALTTGCINGVFRRRLVGCANENGWTVQEVMAYPTHLREADAVFAGNVTGLRALATLDNEPLPCDPEILRNFGRLIF